MTSAVDFLSEQHRQVEQLFDEIDRAEEGEAFGFIESLADLLAIHTSIEEQIFYPGVRRQETEEDLADSVDEHDEMKRLLRELVEAEPEEVDYRALFNQVKELVQHHVGDEEQELFPKVKKLFDARRLEEMGAQMEQLAQRLEQEEVPSEPIEEEQPYA
jgi:hemerythrin superfamily protein